MNNIFKGYPFSKGILTVNTSSFEEIQNYIESD